MRRPLRLITTAAAAASLLSSGSARAEESVSATLLIDSGNVELTVEMLVRATAESSIRDRGLQLAPPMSAGRVDPAALHDCAEDRACRRRLLGTAEVARVFVLSARRSGSSADEGLVVSGRVIDVATGQSLAAASSECAAPCQSGRLTATVQALTFQLVRESKEPQPGGPETVATPADSPPVDTPVSQTPATADSDLTGPELSGVGDTQGGAGVDDSVATGRPFRVWKYAALAAGVVAIGTGATLVAIDGPRIEDGVRQPRERASRAQGYGLIGAGALLVGTGVALWVFDGRPTGVAAAPEASGASVAVWSSF